MQFDHVVESIPGEGWTRLENVVAILRGDHGCPWDRKQTLNSLKSCLLEEAYELLDVMDSEDVEAHQEELGDVLLQVVIQTQLRKEQGAFDLDDVAHKISEKLIRRHPHVFEDLKVADSEEVLRNWEAIKATEKKRSDKENPTNQPRSAVAGVPRALPSLLRAQRVQEKVARVGFDWPEVSDALDKLSEEIEELKEAMESENVDEIRHELGDVLFSIVNYSRFLGIDAEEALDLTNQRFMKRFQGVENLVFEEGKRMQECTLEELDVHWEAVKKAERE